MIDDQSKVYIVDIHKIVHAIFEKNAERVFIIESETGHQYTYGEFYAIARHIAYLLHLNGICQKDRVAILLTNSVEFGALYFACLFLGAIAVPVNPKFHRSEIDFIISHCDIRLLVYSLKTEKIIDEIPSLHSMPKLSLSSGDNYDVINWRSDHKIKGDDLFLITFTSGTTSMPKGVIHRVRGMIENALVFNSVTGVNRDNRFLHVMSMSYMAGILNTLLCPFLAGSSILLEHPFDVRSVLRFWRPVIQYHADTFWLSPTMLVALLQADRDTMGKQYCSKSIKNVFVGTAPLPLKTKKDFENKYGIPLYESYGLSELLLVTTNSSTVLTLDGSVGKQLPGVEMRIVDDKGEPLDRNIDGEVWAKTPYVMAGYLNYETLEPDFISPDMWFPTGDIGHINRDGQLFIIGRKKDLIIKGGENISPRAIEDVIIEHESIDQVAVIGIPHYFYGEEIAAVVKLKSGYSFDDVLPELNKLCIERLKESSIPAKFINIETIPVSSTGKIQKARLREMLFTDSRPEVIF